MKEKGSVPPPTRKREARAGGWAGVSQGGNEVTAAGPLVPDAVGSALPPTSCGAGLAAATPGVEGPRQCDGRCPHRPTGLNCYPSGVLGPNPGLEATLTTAFGGLRHTGGSSGWGGPGGGGAKTGAESASVGRDRGPGRSRGRTAHAAPSGSDWQAGRGREGQPH